MTKRRERTEARRLRNKGWSVKRIASRLGVAPSSVSAWCRDIKLDKEVQKALQSAAQRAGTEAIRKKARERHNEAREQGRKQVGRLTERDWFMLGLGLYWGEGSKRYPYQVTMANTDPDLLRVFIRWARSLGVKQLRATLHLPEGFDDMRCRRWWARKLGLSLRDFNTTVTAVSRASQKKNARDDYRGTLKLAVRNPTRLLHRIRGMIEALKTP